MPTKHVISMGVNHHFLKSLLLFVKSMYAEEITHIYISLGAGLSKPIYTPAVDGVVAFVHYPVHEMGPHVIL